MKNILVLSAFAFLISCSENPDGTTKEKTGQQNIEPAKAVVPTTRDSVRKNAVASFSERTDNPLNEWYFKVELFETPETFYKIRNLCYYSICICYC